MSMQPDNSKDQFRRLLVLIAVATVDMVGGSMVFPLIPFYALKLHASPPVIGMIISSFFVAQLVSAPLWGRVSDRYGRRPALLVGLSASAGRVRGFRLREFSLVAVPVPNRAGSWRRDDRSASGVHRRHGTAGGSSTIARMAFCRDERGHHARSGDRVLCHLLGAGRAGCSRVSALPDQRDFRLEVAAGIEAIAYASPGAETGVARRVARA